MSGCLLFLLLIFGVIGDGLSYNDFHTQQLMLMIREHNALEYIWRGIESGFKGHLFKSLQHFQQKIPHSSIDINVQKSYKRIDRGQYPKPDNVIHMILLKIDRSINTGVKLRKLHIALTQLDTKRQAILQLSNKREAQLRKIKSYIAEFNKYSGGIRAFFQALARCLMSTQVHDLLRRSYGGYSGMEITINFVQTATAMLTRGPEMELTHIILISANDSNDRSLIDYIRLKINSFAKGARKITRLFEHIMTKTEALAITEDIVKKNDGKKLTFCHMASLIIEGLLKTIINYDFAVEIDKVRRRKSLSCSPFWPSIIFSGYHISIHIKKTDYSQKNMKSVPSNIFNFAKRSSNYLKSNDTLHMLKRDLYDHGYWCKKVLGIYVLPVAEKKFCIRTSGNMRRMKEVTYRWSTVNTGKPAKELLFDMYLVG